MSQLEMVRRLTDRGQTVNGSAPGWVTVVPPGSPTS